MGRAGFRATAADWRDEPTPPRSSFLHQRRKQAVSFKADPQRLGRNLELARQTLEQTLSQREAEDGASRKGVSTKPRMGMMSMPKSNSAIPSIGVGSKPRLSFP